MKTIRIFIFGFCALVIGATPAYAKEWRGLIPLKSTCEDVKRILGVDKCVVPESTYELSNYRVIIRFAQNKSCKEDPQVRKSKI